MNWLDIVIIICMGIGCVTGLFDGFVRQVVSFIGLLAAIFFAKQVATPIRGFLGQFEFFSSMDGAILMGICYVLSFILIIVAIAFIGSLIHFAVKKTPARALNCILGGLFGWLIWTFSLSILLNLEAVFDKQELLINKQTKNSSVLYTKVVSVVPTIYPFFKGYFK